MVVRKGLVVVHHETRDVYTVYDITNDDSDRPNFKPTVSYMRADGKTFSRELERFTEASFTVLYDGTRKVQDGDVRKHPVLDLQLNPEDNDAEAETVRQYLGKLLEKAWTEGEDFSGKRPFGNSGWEYDLLNPLALAGMIQAKKHKHTRNNGEEFISPEISDAAYGKGMKLIAAAIKDMAAGK